MQRNDEGCCPRCPSDIDPNPAYDELSHEVENNVLSVRVGKNVGRIKPVSGLDDGRSDASVVADCEDASGNRCRPGCAKVNVIPNTPAPPKLPAEEMLVLRASRKLLGGDDMRNTLEIELRTPRNYEPLPEPPAPAVASATQGDEVAREESRSEEEKAEEAANGKNGKKKKKKVKLD